MSAKHRLGSGFGAAATTGLAWLIGLVLSLPVWALVFEAVKPGAEVFSQLWGTVLIDYISNTLLLVLLVSLLSLLIGLPVAWLTAMCQFPGRKWLQWAMMLPLAMPSYLIAYVYTDLFDYAGPVQTSLRRWFGWQSPDDYAFFEIRSLGGAALMLALVLFPYLYLIVRTALVEQSFQLIQASRIMGCKPWQSFYRVSLPMVRGAVMVALALIAMETLADFATVHYFAVNTLTTAVYDTWLGYGSLTAAAKISVLMLVLVFAFIGLERYSRRQKAVFERQSRQDSNTLYYLTGLKGWLASGYCLLILFFAFVLPLLVLINYAIENVDIAWNDDFIRYAGISFSIAATVALITIVLSVLILSAQRSDNSAKSHWRNRVPSVLASTGYALPGTVLAIGVLIPLSSLDFALNDLLALFGDWQPGLVFSGTVFAIIFAYVVRFNAVAVGAIESSFNKITPSIDMVSRTLGLGRFKLLVLVHLPLIKKGCFTAALLVFIESMKELPAALLLRPFDFETLATYVYQYVSDEQLENASIAALTIVLVGLIPLIFINRLASKN
ncbi:MAG: iron(III) transport system permease protein [Alteromonadaceae bacterium]|jgi:iron(III) transport system permease protein